MKCLKCGTDNSDKKYIFVGTEVISLRNLKAFQSIKNN